MRSLPTLVLLLLGLALIPAYGAEEKPLPRFAPQKLAAALEDAGMIFEGEVVEADLKDDGIATGFFGVHCKRVVYAVTDPVKGSFGKQVEIWFLLNHEVGGDHLDPAPKSLRLDPKLFAKGNVHLVYCLNSKDPKCKGRFSAAFGDWKPGARLDFALAITPDVKDAKAKAKAKVEGGPQGK